MNTTLTQITILNTFIKCNIFIPTSISLSAIEPSAVKTATRAFVLFVLFHVQLIHPVTTHTSPSQDDTTSNQVSLPCPSLPWTPLNLAQSTNPLYSTQPTHALCSASNHSASQHPTTSHIHEPPPAPHVSVPGRRPDPAVHPRRGAARHLAPRRAQRPLPSVSWKGKKPAVKTPTERHMHTHRRTHEVQRHQRWFTLRSTEEL